MHAPEPNPHGPPGLRRVALFSFPLAVILFLCHFFSNLRPLPFLGLLPLGFSAAHSATTLYPVLRQVVPRVLPLSRSTHTPLLIDAILASVYLIVWPLSVSVISDDYYGTPVLGAYCTVFLIVVGYVFFSGHLVKCYRACMF